MRLNGHLRKCLDLSTIVECIRIVNEETQEETEEFIRLAETQKNMKIVAGVS